MQHSMILANACIRNTICFSGKSARFTSKISDINVDLQFNIINTMCIHEHSLQNI